MPEPSNHSMTTSSRYLIVLFVVAVLASVAITYWTTMVKQDFVILNDLEEEEDSLEYAVCLNYFVHGKRRNSSSSLPTYQPSFTTRTGSPRSQRSAWACSYLPTIRKVLCHASFCSSSLSLAFGQCSTLCCGRQTVRTR